MQQYTFYIERKDNQEVIHVYGNPVTISVHRLTKWDTFYAGDDQVTFFGEYEGLYFAFTAVDNPDQFPMITAALTWYASYINYPGMMYSVNDPRPRGLRLVR